MNRQKKALLLLWTYIIVIMTPKFKTSKNKENIIYNNNYIDEETSYATYKNKDIYIISVETAKELVKDDNIYLIDDRLSEDPDMSVCNSYNFKSLKDINTILTLLIDYENSDPTDWNRSYKSMKNEWLIHNICYFLNIQKSRTEQVDFDNSDEKTYLNYLRIIKEILNTNNSEIENIKAKTLTK